MLVQRACKEILPTNVNLNRRKVEVNTTCPKCGEMDETVVHAETTWGIWRERNNELYGEQTKTTQATAAFIKQYNAEFNNAQVPRVSQSTSSRHWLRPTEGRVKVNFDGAFAKQDRKGGAGVVIRDHNGHVLGAAAIQIHAVNDPFQVESRAVVLSLQFAHEMGFTNIDLEGDCLTVVRSLKMTTMDLSPIGVIIEEARKRMFHSCNVPHVLRSGNRVAHKLARHSILLENDEFWVEEFLAVIAETLHDDCIQYLSNE
ncbi:uncharacterized protein LOC111308119 [Durio zibethinus]|uniref:Uncharacterized protein LOC111308119 n=1 Tax=Durio zibethinus TaxID=66656 RepID=A0A6P6ABA1_DURZI|nr:uncharacterized protein LOC111308119 [Durio zibethinus]